MPMVAAYSWLKVIQMKSSTIPKPRTCKCVGGYVQLEINRTSLGDTCMEQSKSEEN